MKFRVTLLLFAIIPIQLFSATAGFSRNLSVGMSGEDVRALQIVLNTDQETLVANSGAGSPGNETIYFGPATKRALAKFQEKYRDEVLAPIGLYFGTGFFGERTSMKMSALLQKQNGPFIAQEIVSLGVQKATTSLVVDFGRSKSLDTFPFIDKKYFNVTANGIATIGGYYSKYAKITMEVTFSQEELDAMKKKNEISNENGEKKDRILLLEELMDAAKKGDTSKELKASFMAWADLDKRMVDELKKTPIISAVFDANQEIASWFHYHGLIAERFGSETLSTLEMDNLSKEFKKYATTHVGLYGKSIAKAQEKEPAFFSIINKAEASGCGATHFGGRVAVYLTCNFGTVQTIVGTCGGQILFNWAVQAANPYLSHNIYTPGVAVLGKSVINPASFCPLGFPPFMVPIPTTDIGIYYGTAVM